MPVRRAAIVTACFLAAGSSSALADPGKIGQWGPVQEYPLAPVSAIMTPDGNIVAWDQADAGEQHSWAGKSGKAFILNPNTGEVIGRSANLSPASVFCPVITTLPDGKIQIAGGGAGTPLDTVQIYDPASKTFGLSSKLSSPRWYPGGATTKDGDLVTMGGNWGSGVDVLSAATGQNRRLGVRFGMDWYPVVLRMPDGRFAVDSAPEGQSTGATRQILDITGVGSFAAADDLSLLKSRNRRAVTRVGPFAALSASGWESGRESYVLDTSSGRTTVRATGPLAKDHINGLAVTLPDGSAVLVGGETPGAGPETLRGESAVSVMTPEMWSPTTNRWTSMADAPRQRLYHSVATLLPDGRVWTAGTTVWRKEAFVTERNGAVFTPPYLFKQDGSGQLAPRPQITSAPATAAWGSSLQVTSPEAASIRSAALVRLSATTHQHDAGGAYIPLSVRRTADTQLTTEVPANGNAVPAGDYMLFLINSAGVPSKASMIRIDATPSSVPNTTTMMSSPYSHNPKSGVSDFPAWMGNDGNPSTFFHTGFEKEAWWQIDYGRSKPIGNVVLTNRQDCCGQKLAGAWVLASDQPFTSTSLGAARSQPGVSAAQIGDNPGAVINVAMNRTARYIRIQIPGTDFLHLGEVTTTEAAAATANLTSSTIASTRSTITVRIANSGSAAGTINGISAPRGWRFLQALRTPRTLRAGESTNVLLSRGSSSGTLRITTSVGVLNHPVTETRTR